MTGRVGREVARQQESRGGEVVANGEAAVSLVTFVHQMRGEISRALPKHLDADRMARLTLTVLRQTPKLMLSTQESFAGALLTASALGLEPGLGSESEAWLVPYENKKKHIVECQLILGYKGISKLFYQHPLAKHLDAQTVHANDDFDYAYGSEPYLRHRPARGDRGAVIGYYGIASLSTGAQRFEFLTPDEVAAIRGKASQSGDVRDPQRWMERKTVLKQVLKPMPKSPIMAHAIAADERSGADLAGEKIPEAISAQPLPSLTAQQEPPAPEQPARDPEAEPADSDVNEPIDPDTVDPETGEIADPVRPAEPEGWRQ